jgi:hypothetical protein
VKPYCGLGNPVSIGEGNAHGGSSKSGVVTDLFERADAESRQRKFEHGIAGGLSSEIKSLQHRS